MAQLASTTVFGELLVTAKSLLQGNVGIGTTSPEYALDVSGDVRATGTFRGSLTVDALSGYGIRPSIELQGVHANDATNENSGAAIFFRTSTSAGYGPMISGIRRSGGAGALVFLTNTSSADSQTERMRIAENGNVGIGTTAPAYKLDVSGDVRATGTFRGSLTGNASTATTLATARTINGTSFDGSANITTANWGTARTLTIGSTGKSVNGSSNVSWTLAEIGAAPASHTHTASQVGLGNVQNYGIATQAQAQAGTANDVYMTPLRVKEAISSLAPSSHTHAWSQITSVPSASTSAKGIVQLSSAVNSTSTTLAATASAVKAAYDATVQALNAHAETRAAPNKLGHVYHAILTTTLNTTWQGSQAPYTKTQTVSGLLATDTPIVDVVMSGNFATDQARIEAWGYVYRITTANNSITLYATEKPTVSLPIQLKVVS